MSESPQQRTTRKIVSAMENNELFHQATVYLYGDSEENQRTIARLKRLITLENDQLIMYFISKAIDKEDGVIVPYITFRSEGRIKGKSVLTEEKKYDGLFRVVGSAKHKNYISTNMEKRYAGTIKSIKDHGVYDLSIVELPIRINRFGFLNKTKNN